MRVTVVAVCLLWFVIGCDKPRTLTVDNPFAPAEMTVRFRGEVVRRFHEPKSTMTVHARSTKGTWEITEDVKLTIATPCGEIAPPRVFPADVAEASFRMEVWQSWVKVWVDNRGGPARALGVGDVRYEAKPDALSSFEILVEHCAPPVPIVLDGKRIGAIEDVRGHGVLVDPTGARCYQLRHVKYGMGSEYPGDPPAFFAPAEVHALAPIVEHMLEPAPSKVTVHMLDAARHSILEVPCAP